MERNQAHSVPDHIAGHVTIPDMAVFLAQLQMPCPLGQPFGVLELVHFNNTGPRSMDGVEFSSQELTWTSHLSGSIFPPTFIEGK